MKKYLIITVAIIMFGITFIACNPEIDGNSQSTITFSPLLITDSLITLMGEHHNACVTSAFSDFDWDAQDYKTELINQFINKGFIDNTFDTTDIANNYETNLTLLENSLSAEAFSYIEDGIDLTTNIVSFASFSQDIGLIENTVKTSTLSNIEKNAVLVGLGFFRSSAYYWIPANIGGEGTGDDILCDMKKKKKPKNTGGKALVADGLSASGGMFVGAGIFYSRSKMTIAVESAVASATTAVITQ